MQGCTCITLAHSGAVQQVASPVQVGQQGLGGLQGGQGGGQLHEAGHGTISHPVPAVHCCPCKHTAFETVLIDPSRD